MKSLEEFRKWQSDRAREYCNSDPDDDALQRAHAHCDWTAGSLDTAAEILRVAEEFIAKKRPELFCRDGVYEDSECIGIDNGMRYVYDFLKSYINSTNTEGGDGK